MKRVFTGKDKKNHATCRGEGLFNAKLRKKGCFINRKNDRRLQKTLDRSGYALKGGNARIDRSYEESYAIQNKEGGTSTTVGKRRERFNRGFLESDVSGKGSYQAVRLPSLVCCLSNASNKHCTDQSTEAGAKRQWKKPIFRLFKPFFERLMLREWRGW